MNAHSRAVPRRLLTGLVASLSFLLNPLPTHAANTSAVISGTITNRGAPVAYVEVVAAGNNMTATATTDAKGRFAFRPLALGTYDIRASAHGLSGSVRVDLSSGGATVSVELSALKEIGNVVSSRAQTQTLRGSGSDVVLNHTALTQLPFNNSFTEMMTQLPGAVRGADGVVHVNGDHGVINYQIDGVPVPQELNRDIGTEFNLNDLSFVNAVEGAYPAQYGLKFGAVLNMASRAGTGPAGFDGYATMGSYTTMQSSVGYHAPIGTRGGVNVALSGLKTTRGLDPPNFDSPHNNAASVGQFLRVTLPSGANDFTNVTFFNSRDSFQIPNDVAGGEPAMTDDNETQGDTFFTAQYHHAIGKTGSLVFGPAFSVSRIADFGDPMNDWIYGETLNTTSPPFGNGGQTTDCAQALINPAVVFAPTTCGYSLADSRTAVDDVLQADYNQQFGKHYVSAGGSWDLTHVFKHYAITLQPGNFLAPILTPHTPGAAATVIDDHPNLGNTYQSYVADNWRMSSLWEVDYGMRYDFFTIKSSEFDNGFGSFSPRLKLTRFWGDRASLYAYVGRFFEPFSFENVSPSAAYLLNLPLQPTIEQFDLKPERDTQIELGGHIPLGRGDLGFRIWQKNANDLIDDTQVGVTLLHQDINYVLGRLSQEAVTFQEPLAQNGRFYAAIAHVVSHNSGCETQLLAPCFGAPTGYTPADHEQNWTINGGVLFNNHSGGWFSMDGEYGSGLSSASCPAGTPGYCKKTPHTIFNVEEGIAFSPKGAITLDIQNLFNDRYYVTLLNAQGNHYAAPREFIIGVRFKP